MKENGQIRNNNKFVSKIKTLDGNTIDKSIKLEK